MAYARIFVTVTFAATPWVALFTELRRSLLFFTAILVQIYVYALEEPLAPFFLEYQ